MKEMIALASPPDGYTLDPARHDRIPKEDQLRPMPVFTPIRLSMALESIAKPGASQRVLKTKGGLQHKFNPVKPSV
jgi:hypothetical protein